jgi:hypothetical protein
MTKSRTVEAVFTFNYEEIYMMYEGPTFVEMTGCETTLALYHCNYQQTSSPSSKYFIFETSEISLGKH